VFFFDRISFVDIDPHRLISSLAPCNFSDTAGHANCKESHFSASWNVQHKAMPIIESEIESADVDLEKKTNGVRVVHFCGDGLFYDKHQGHTNRLTGNNIFAGLIF
jgi:hypothetical protein